MRHGGRTARGAACMTLLAVPLLGPSPATAACGNLGSSTTGTEVTVRQVRDGASGPTSAPCPSPDPLGPTTDDDEEPGVRTGGLAVAAVALIAAGLVLRGRSGRS